MKVSRIINLYHTIINSFIYILRRDPLVIEAWVNVKYGRIVSRNWGDDINVYLIEMMTGKRVVVKNQSLYHNCYYKGPVYSCIGSIIGWYDTANLIIWGSGAIKHDTLLRQVPKKICSVRGEKSKEYLINHGIKCPCKYGDPALLISKYYSPKPSRRRYRLGIIPHYMDLDNPIISTFLNRHDDVLLIDLVNYKKWTDIPDQIASCDCIISSSLHGLIVSDSYSIPNVWISFSDQLIGGEFKFLDYFSSVQRAETRTQISSLREIEELYSHPRGYYNAIIDYETIRSSAPFALRDFSY